MLSAELALSNDDVSQQSLVAPFACMNRRCYIAQFGTSATQGWVHRHVY